MGVWGGETKISHWGKRVYLSSLKTLA